MSDTRWRLRRCFWIVGIVATATMVCGYVAYQSAVREIVGSRSEMFQGLRETRGIALIEYLTSVREEARFWARNRIMRDALQEFSAAWRELGGGAERTLQRLYIDENPYPIGKKDNLESAGDGSSYSEIHARYHYWLRTFLIHRGLYDVFLFDPTGALVYTSFKERDFATNLVEGPWAGTDLGKAFRSARDNPFPSYVAFFDFARYEPSHGAPASFISIPVLADDGAFLGVLAFQLPSSRLNEIMQVSAGMGETGETYIVGPDLLMRSDSRFSKTSTILETRVDTEPARRALAGETGLEMALDYRGVRVLSAFGPVEFEDVTWAVLAEIDEGEILAPASRLRWRVVQSGGALALLLGILSLLWPLRGSEGRAGPRADP